MARYSARSIRSRLRTLYLPIILFLSVFVYSTGWLNYLLVETYDANSFRYPVDIPNFHRFIRNTINSPNQMVNSSHVKQLIAPINSYDYQFTVKNAEKCKDLQKQKKCRRLKDGTMSASCQRKLSLALMIKSSLSNVVNRDAIRETWGYEHRLIDVDVKRLFIVGSCSPESTGSQRLESHTSLLCQDAIDQENLKFNDIIQGDFIDTYYNNTIKTMMAFKWVNKFCNKVDHVLFVDDDYYISPKNLLKLIRRLREDVSSPSPNGQYDDFGDITSDDAPVHRISGTDEEIDTRIYAGFVFHSSIPQRSIFERWSVSLSQYPYSRYPPFVTAGAYLVSQNALAEINAASRYVKHFIFDDVYLGLIAHKINLSPIHVEEFHFYKKPRTKPGDYATVIATHGYSDVHELRNVWMQEKSLGHV